MGRRTTAPEETPAQWWVKQLAEDADGENVNEFASRIFDACAHEGTFNRAEMDMALAKALAIVMLDAGRSGRNPEYLKDAACALVTLCLDTVSDHIKRKAALTPLRPWAAGGNGRRGDRGRLCLRTSPNLTNNATTQVRPVSSGR